MLIYAMLVVYLFAARSGSLSLSSFVLRSRLPVSKFTTSCMLMFGTNTNVSGMEIRGNKIPQ